MKLIEIINVTKKFGEFKAVDEVNLKIDKGSFIGLLGPNGAGKTTLIRIIIGLGKPTEGQVQIGGERVGRNNDNLKKKIGIVPQHTNLDKELTVYENLVLQLNYLK